VPQINTKPVAIRIHTHDGVVDVVLEDVLALTLVPYPVLVMKKNSDGKFKRYANFPIEFLDEEVSIVSGGVRGLDGLPPRQ
jgi:hypothetical protein